MKRSRWITLLLFLLVSGIANADSIPVFNVSASFDIEPGEDNQGFVGFIFEGQGIEIIGAGSYSCGGWCNFFTYVPAGFPIDIENITAVTLTVQIGGQTYNENEAVLVPWTINPSGNFEVPGGVVTAVLNNGLILGSVGTGNNIFQFYLKIPPGQLALFFPQSDIDPSVYTFVGAGFFSAASAVPEPDTLALMAAGCIVGLSLKKRSWARRSGHMPAP